MGDKVWVENILKGMGENFVKSMDENFVKVWVRKDR